MDPYYYGGSGATGMPMGGNPYGGGLGGMTSQLGLLLGSFFAGDTGMLFGTGPSSILDRRRAIMQGMEYQQMMAAGAQLDRNTQMEQMRTIAQSLGMAWGPSQMQTADTFLGALQPFMPMVAQMFPGFAQAIGGRRGSMALMNAQLFQGGLQRIDPVTGQIGYGTNTTQALAQDIYNQMYAGSLADQRLLTGDQMGGMFVELSRRGLMGGVTQEQLAGAAYRGQLSNLAAGYQFAPGSRGAQIQQEMGMGLATDSQVRDLLKIDSFRSTAAQTINTNEAIQTLRQYEKVLGSLREVFGDAGNPNAPIPELMKALDQITGGTTQQFTSGQLEDMVRNTKNIAAQTGLGVPAVLAMHQQAFGMTQQLGISRAFTNDLALSQAAFMGTANAIERTGWGRQTIGELGQLQQRMEARGLQSQVGQALGLYGRLEELAGPTDPDSAAFKWRAAISNGESTFQHNGRSYSTRLSPAQIAQMFGSSFQGVSSGTALDMLNDRSLNEEYLQRSGAMEEVFRQQGKEFIEMGTGAAVMGPMAQAARDLGIDPRNPNSRRLLATIGREAMQSLMGMDTKTMGDSEKRNAALAAQIQQGFKARGINISGNRASTLATQIYGNYDTLAQEQGYGNFLGLYDLYSDQSIQEQQRQRVTMEAESRIEKMMASAIGPTTYGARFAEAVRSGATSNVGEVIGRVFGLESGEGLSNTLELAGTALQADIARVDQLRAQLSDPNTDSSTRANIENELRALQGSIAKNSKLFELEADKSGLLMQGRITREQRNAVRGIVGANSKADSMTKFRAARRYASDILKSEETYQRLGWNGRSQLEMVSGAVQELEQLAATHTGGNVEALLKASEGEGMVQIGSQDTNLEKARVQALQAQIFGGTATLADMEEAQSTQSGKMTDPRTARMSANFRNALRGAKLDGQAVVFRSMMDLTKFSEDQIMKMQFREGVDGARLRRDMLAERENILELEDRRFGEQMKLESNTAKDAMIEIQRVLGGDKTGKRMSYKDIATDFASDPKLNALLAGAASSKAGGTGDKIENILGGMELKSLSKEQRQKYEQAALDEGSSMAYVYARDRLLQEGTGISAEQLQKVEKIGAQAAGQTMGSGTINITDAVITITNAMAGGAAEGAAESTPTPPPADGANFDAAGD